MNDSYFYCLPFSSATLNLINCAKIDCNLITSILMVVSEHLYSFIECTRMGKSVCLDYYRSCWNGSIRIKRTSLSLELIFDLVEHSAWLSGERFQWGLQFEQNVDGTISCWNGSIRIKRTSLSLELIFDLVEHSAWLSGERFQWGLQFEQNVDGTIVTWNIKLEVILHGIPWLFEDGHSSTTLVSH